MTIVTADIVIGDRPSIVTKFQCSLLVFSLCLINSITVCGFFSNNISDLIQCTNVQNVQCLIYEHDR